MARRKRGRGNGQGSIFKRQERGPYYVTWYDHNGQRRTHCTKTTDRGAAQRILADKVAAVALRRDGVIDARQESIVIESGKSIASCRAGSVTAAGFAIARPIPRPAANIAAPRATIGQMRVDGFPRGRALRGADRGASSSSAAAKSVARA